MKRIIEFILLALIFALLIGVTCYICSWKVGMTLWGIAFALASMIVIAIYLIEKGE